MKEVLIILVIIILAVVISRIMGGSRPQTATQQDGEIIWNDRP